MADSDPTARSPFSVPNVRLFIAFRILFNARFYYPIFAILFLDFGLTSQQFALLNAAWAASIVLLEVPSGAVADTIGRRNLLRVCAGLMVAEMAILTFTPRGDPTVLFFLFLLNRILSGAAEAAASGADEALAYDSLEKEGLSHCWSQVLEVLMRWQSVAFVGALLLGGMLYDQDLMQTVVNFLGMDWEVSKNLTMRLPIALVFLESLGVLWVTLQMKEVEGEEERQERAEEASCSRWEYTRRTAVKAFKTTLQAGGWILKTPFATVIILYGFLFDSIIRVFLTFNSQYYRVIELPEASYGMIGASFATVGILVPKAARYLVEHRTPLFNAGLLFVLTTAGLTGLMFPVPVWGLLPVIPLMAVMYFLNYFLSHYLNRITDSKQRATVLSFRGLAFNLAYGMVGALYAGVLHGLHGPVQEAHPQLEGTALEDKVFAASLDTWLPWFLFTMVLATLFSAWRLRGRKEHRRVE